MPTHTGGHLEDAQEIGQRPFDGKLQMLSCFCLRTRAFDAENDMHTAFRNCGWFGAIADKSTAGDILLEWRSGGKAGFLGKHSSALPHEHLEITMKNRHFLYRLRFAMRGLQEGWRRERSFRTQALIAPIVVLAAILLGIPGIWLAVIALAIAMVLAAELFNSALEALVDHLHPEVRPEIGAVKDMAAAAVLLVCLGAMAIGLLFVASHS